MEQKLITAPSWIWVLIIYQAKETFQEFWTVQVNFPENKMRSQSSTLSD